MKEKVYSVFDGVEWRSVGENYVKDIKNKEEIDYIYEYSGGVKVVYKDGSTARYQNIHGNFVFQY